MSRSDRDFFLQSLFGYRLSQCLYVAAKLGIAERLKDGKVSCKQLASSVNVDEEALCRVLRCLSAFGFFVESENKCFGMTRYAEFLLPEKLKAFTLMCGEEFYKSMEGLLYSVETGNPYFDKVYGADFWHYMECMPSVLKNFTQAMQGGFVDTNYHIIKEYDFSKYSTIVDVGGGVGDFLMAILQAYPRSAGVVFDLPSVVKISGEYLACCESELTQRISLVSGDFFSDVIPAADLIMMKVILHDWSDESSLKILKNCTKAMSSNSRLILIEKVLSKDSENFKNTCLGDVHMLAVHGGKERSIDDYQELFSKVNLSLARIIPTDTDFSILEAVLIA